MEEAKAKWRDGASTYSTTHRQADRRPEGLNLQPLPANKWLLDRGDAAANHNSLIDMKRMRRGIDCGKTSPAKEARSMEACQSKHARRVDEAFIGLARPS
jgi:hypothetical protein